MGRKLCICRTSMSLHTAFFLSLMFITSMYHEVLAQLTLSAELRPRLEFRDGYRTLPPEGSNPAFFVSQRTRLNIGYTQKIFSLKITVQDVRTWGDEELGVDVAATNIHEAYGLIQLCKTFSMQIGRQEFIYDDERLLGASNWSQQAKSFDAALFKYNSNGWAVDAAGAFNQQKENLFETDYTLNNFKVLGFVHAGRMVLNKYKVYLVGITDGFQGSDSTQNLFMRYTYGANGEYEFAPIKVKAMAYGQSGTDKTDAKISAYMFSAQGYYNSNKFTGGVGVDYLSGDDATEGGNDVVNTFNTLYATNHGLYGHIDYFESIPTDTKNGGLIDPYLKLKYSLNGKLTGYLDYHYFLLAGKVPDPSNGSEPINSYLGSEIDLWFIYKIIDGLELRSGVSAMLATESMNVVKGGGRELNGWWGYLQLTFNPTIFKS